MNRTIDNAFSNSNREVMLMLMLRVVVAEGRRKCEKCFYQFEVVFCRQDADDLEALLVGWAWAFFLLVSWSIIIRTQSG
jgi:hypothetical protein